MPAFSDTQHDGGSMAWLILEAALVRAAFIGKANMEDPVLTYFSENLATVSKEELLQALQAALGSAKCWREACLLGVLSNPKQKRRN